MVKQRNQRSLAEVEKTSVEMVKDAMALHPDLPAANLLEPILHRTDADFLDALDAILRRRYFLGLIRRERAAARRGDREKQWLFPQVREWALQLPARVKIGERNVKREDLRYPDLAVLIKQENAGDRDGHKNNPRIVAAKELRGAWPKRKRNSKTTLAQIDHMKAERAGLIDE